MLYIMWNRYYFAGYIPDGVSWSSSKNDACGYSSYDEAVKVIRRLQQLDIIAKIVR